MQKLVQIHAHYVHTVVPAWPGVGGAVEKASVQILQSPAELGECFLASRSGLIIVASLGLAGQQSPYVCGGDPGLCSL